MAHVQIRGGVAGWYWTADLCIHLETQAKGSWQEPSSRLLFRTLNNFLLCWPLKLFRAASVDPHHFDSSDHRP